MMTLVYVYKYKHRGCLTKVVSSVAMYSLGSLPVELRLEIFIKARQSAFQEKTRRFHLKHSAQRQHFSRTSHSGCVWMICPRLRLNLEVRRDRIILFVRHCGCRTTSMGWGLRPPLTSEWTQTESISPICTTCAIRQESSFRKQSSFTVGLLSGMTAAAITLVSAYFCCRTLTRNV